MKSSTNRHGGGHYNTLQLYSLPELLGTCRSGGWSETVLSFKRSVANKNLNNYLARTVSISALDSSFYV